MKQLLAILIAGLFIVPAVQAASTDELISQGTTLWSEGKLDEAEAAFKQALQADPESSKANERLASLYLTQNKTGEAIAAYQDAIILDSQNADLFVGIAIAYLHKKYYQMAESMVNHAIELDPELQNAQKLKQYIDAKNQENTQSQN
jgi:tetratricopeptide (TPR) repeat protein